MAWNPAGQGVNWRGIDPNTVQQPIQNQMPKPTGGGGNPTVTTQPFMPGPKLGSNPFGNASGQIQYDAEGRPMRPAFDSLFDPKTKRLQGDLSLSRSMNPLYQQRMDETALRAPGEASQWRQLQGQALQDQAAQAMAGSQAQTAQAMNQLAMRGGLRSGAAERLAQRGMEQGLGAQQAILRQQTGLDIEDERQRLQQLASGAQFQRGTEQFDIAAALNEENLRRAADLEAYNEAMRAWAAMQTGNAIQANSGGGSGGGSLVSTILNPIQSITSGFGF